MSTPKQKSPKKGMSYGESNLYLMNFRNDKRIEEILQKEESDEEDDNENKIEKKDEKMERSISMQYYSKEEKLLEKEETEKCERELKEHKEGEENDIIKVKDETNGEKKSLYQRILGPVDAGSVRGSIFNLTIFCLGSGCLNIPQKMGRMSLLVSVIDIILSGIATYFTLNLLILSSKKAKNFNYGEMVDHYFGKVAAFILNVTCLTYNFGILILYMVISNLFYLFN